MSTKIVTDQEPELKTYLVPPTIQQVDYFDGVKLSATLPGVDTATPREVTQVLLSDGTTFFVFDSKVKSRGAEYKLTIAEQMISGMSKKEFDEWVKDRMRHENVPDEATMHRYSSEAMMLTWIEWVWWEVSW